MVMRSPRLASIAALTILGAGLCAACGPISFPLIGSSTNDSVATAPKPAIAVPASSNPNVSATPTVVSATTKKGPQPVAVTRGSITNVLSVDGVVSPQDQTTLTYPTKTTANAVNVKAGQAVHQGDSLIDFDSGSVPKDLDAA